MALDTPGGRIHVQWDHTASASPNAQLKFFAEFLATTGVYECWIDSCPVMSLRSSSAQSTQLASAASGSSEAGASGTV